MNDLNHLFIQRPADGQVNRLETDVQSIKQTRARARGAPPMIITTDERAVANYNNTMAETLRRESFFLGGGDFMVDSRERLRRATARP